MNDAFQNLPHMIFQIINPFMFFLLLILIALVLLFSVSPVFAIGMTVWIALFLVITIFTLKKSLVFNKSYSEEKSKIIGLFADYLSNIINVKLFSNNLFEQGRLLKLQKPFVEIAEQGGLYITKIYAFLGLLTSLYAFGFISMLILGNQKGTCA